MTAIADADASGDRVADEGTPVRIRATRSLCLGWGNCHRWAPEVYFLDDEGYEIGFQFLEVPAALAEAAWIGADACPERAIQVLGPRPPRRDRPRPVVASSAPTGSAAPAVPTDSTSPPGVAVTDEEDPDGHDRS